MQFMAPEVAQQAGQGVKSDIWSVGCTVIQMLTASPPWNDSTNVMALIFRIGSAKGPPEFPPSISAACANFLSLCFKLKAEDRPSCQQLLLHEFGGGGGAGEGGGAEKGSVGGRPAAAHDCAARSSVEPGGSSGGERGSAGAGLGHLHASDSLGQHASDSPGTHPPGADGKRGVALGFEDDCDLALMCEGNVCSVLRGAGFAKIWAGGRCNVGLSGACGLFAFEVHVLRELTVTLQEAGAASPDTMHICRVGWSTRRSPTHALGENSWGWGYGGTARKAHDGVFEAYGERYGAGDVITCGVDLATGEVCFAKNGRELGVAYRLQRPCIDAGIVPHILLKNMEVRVDWSSRNCSSCLPGYLPLQRAVALGACTHPVALAARPEVVMLVGLPACGKTTWAQEHAEKHPDARYMVLSTDHILEQMKVSGLTRSNYSVRWEQLMPEASEVLNKLIEVASKRRRNYLWDQTNVYASARRRKLAPFRGFLKRAVVLVLSSPTLEQRTRAREASEGKVVPEEAVQQMRSNFMPPSTSEGFDEVEFVGDLTADEAMAHIAADRKTAALWLAAHKKRKTEEEEEEMRKRAQVQHVLLPGTALRPGAEEDSMRSLNTIHAPPPQEKKGGGMGGGGAGGAGGMEMVGGRGEGQGPWQGGGGRGGNGWYWPQQPPPNPHAHAPAFYPGPPGPHHQLPPWVAAAAAPPRHNYPPPQHPLGYPLTRDHPPPFHQLPLLSVSHPVYPEQLPRQWGNGPQPPNSGSSNCH